MKQIRGSQLHNNLPDLLDSVPFYPIEDVYQNIILFANPSSPQMHHDEVAAKVEHLRILEV